MPTERRPALDVLRTAVVIGLVFFHAALVFDASDDFYVKNPQTTGVTPILAGLGVVWAMPLLFAVAGVGARHSLRSLDTLEKLLLQVTRKNDARGYERFKDLFEAIIAYNE